MDNDETKKLDLSEINSNNGYTNIDDNTINNFDDLDEDFTRVIDSFEEIDNINNLSGLEEDVRSEYEKKGYIRKPTPPQKPKTTKRKSTKDLDNNGKPSANFYIITLIIAINVCIVIFLLVFNMAVSNSDKKNNTGNNNNTNVVSDESNYNDQTEQIVESTNVVESVGLVENVATSGSMQIYDFNDDKSVNLKCVTSTKITDEYGKPLVIEEIEVGEIVKYSYEDGQTSLSAVSKSNDAFRESKLTGAINDTDAKTLTFGSKTYAYNDKTIVNFERGSYKPTDICEYDVVNIIGYEDTIYSIEVIKGHGEVTFVKNPDIINCVVEIDTTATYNMEELTTLTLAEGAHQIVVKGDNIDPFVADFLVTPEKPTEVSLLLVSQKEGLFVPTISPSDATLQIDGQVIDTSKPILLDYGPHTINVSKDGYSPYQDTLTISGQETRINIALEELVLSGKINITTDPAGANVYIDNAYVGVSPITAPVEYGSHTILIRMDGYIDITYPVEVEKGDNAFFYRLQKKEDAVVTE